MELVIADAEIDARLDARLARAEVPVGIEVEAQQAAGVCAEPDLRVAAATIELHPEHVVRQHVDVVTDEVTELGELVRDLVRELEVMAGRDIAPTLGEPHVFGT